MEHLLRYSILALLEQPQADIREVVRLLIERDFRKRPACPLCRECCVEDSVHYRIMDTIGVACDEASEASGLV